MIKNILRAVLLSGMVFTAAPALADHHEGLHLQVVRTMPMAAGRTMPVLMEMKHGAQGLPVLKEELDTFYAHKIHMFAIDSGLNDFHYINPRPAGMPGQYAFLMKPQTSCDYVAWILMDLKSQTPQLAPMRIKGASNSSCEDAVTDFDVNQEYVAYTGHKFILDLPEAGLAPGQQATIKLKVRDKEGRPFTELQNLMNAFASMTVFYDDFETMQTLFSEGYEEGQPEAAHEITGPELTFNFTPDQGGYAKIFIRVKIDDEVLIVPFTVAVAGGSSFQDIPLDGEADIEEFDGGYNPFAIEDGEM